MGINFVVDSREVSSGVLEVLLDHSDIDVTVQHLAVGDYLIDDSLLVERKRLPDLVNSIKEGRLFSQARRLTDSGLRNMIILEGTGEDLARSDMRRKAIQGALISVTHFYGLPLMRS